jgi:hypothetical protein
MSDHEDDEEVSYTNRELLELIMAELDMDGELDEPASVTQILDMGALHNSGFSWQYGLMLVDSARALQEMQAAEEERQRGEHLTLVKD